MTPRLAQILRGVQRRQMAEKVQQPKGDISAMIQQLVDRQVEERIVAERDRLQPTGPRLRQMFNAPEPHTDFSQAPEPQRTAPLQKEIPPALIHRDETGRAKWLEIGTARFDLERDSRGRITRMVQRTEK